MLIRNVRILSEIENSCVLLSISVSHQSTLLLILRATYFFPPNHKASLGKSPFDLRRWHGPSKPDNVELPRPSPQTIRRGIQPLENIMVGGLNVLTVMSEREREFEELFTGLRNEMPIRT